jgi:hypothetical protein
VKPPRPQNANLIPAKPGEVRNPWGRPKGSRNKFGEAFIADFYEDWKAHGVEAIKDMREKSPADYVKVAASIIPKQLEINDLRVEDMSDDELIEFVAAVRSAQAGDSGTAAQRRNKAPPRTTETGEPVN